MNKVTITQEQADAKVFPYESLQPCESAFVDMRIPKHEGKKNYSIIGAGVAQSSKQFVNCYEAHGFNIGAVSLPVGHINGLHSHFTAEVFMVQSGLWEFFWGSRGENRVTLGPMSITSVPTWVFRGFRCLEDGFVFTALGGDSTGGVIHHPQIVEESRENGVYLMENNTIVDCVVGEKLPSDLSPMKILSDGEVQSMRVYDEQQMAKRVVRMSQADFSSHAFLDSCLEGHRAYLAPAIGWGLTMDRESVPPIQNPHTFTVEWLRLPPHNSVSLHRIAETQVVLVLEGELSIIYNAKDELQRPSVSVSSRGCASLPPGSWRELTNNGDSEVVALVVCGQDERKVIEWDSEIIKAARHYGWAVDPSNYLANANLLRYVAV